MKSVWVPQGCTDKVAFTDARHIEPSIHVTYSTMNVVINKTFDGSTIKRFDVRKPTKIGEERGELIVTMEFRLYHVYDECTHL